MKKIALMLGLLGLSALANAADPLHGTEWRTIDDETKQPKSIVKFTEQKDGTLKATIQRILTKGEENACSKCEGTYHNKSLKGLTVVSGLKPDGNGKYTGGTILDPKSGKSYRSTGELSGATLTVRGHVGPFKRSQIWSKAN